ncbi:MAG TPA: hypothetical protein VFQ22_13375, partial [Longimicrobiales bacterium]|nr:hypothetical protein [Longimicrobiales bacterium]
MSDIAKRLLLAVLLALAPAACGRDEPVEEPPREPAPVTPEPAGALLDIDPSPRTAVGARSGDPMRMLDRVVTPFLLPGGSLVVPNAGSSSIRVFRRDGTFVRELGGPGEGPGEIGELVAAWA